MSSLPALIHDGAVATGAATVLYAATVSAAAITALLARTATHRRATREILAILLRRNY